MEYEHIIFEETGGIAKISLNRPERLNGLATQTLEELIDAVDRLRDEGTARVLLLTGNGRAFCSGADLAGGSAVNAPAAGGPDAGKTLETHYNPLVERLLELPMPYVTVVNGVAAGAGCSLALLGDIVIAANSAYFLQAFVNIGLVPDVGSTWLLPRLAGRARAQAMMMLGERIPAAQAENWGLIYKAVEDAELAGEAEKIAAKLATGPTLAYTLIRRGIRQSLDRTLSDSLNMERRHQLAAGRSEDCAEGIGAFLQKRPPNFKGR